MMWCCVVMLIFDVQTMHDNIYRAKLRIAPRKRYKRTGTYSHFNIKKISFNESCTSIMHCRHIKGPALLLASLAKN